MYDLTIRWCKYISCTKPHVCSFLPSDYVHQKGTKAAGDKFNFTLFNFS